MPLLTQQLGLPRKVALTALLFLKRFYLSKSVLDADPARFMLTCIYLACKVSRAAGSCGACWSRACTVRFLDVQCQTLTICGQAEESYISADDFCRALQQDAATVLQHEVALLQGLRFDLVVGHVPEITFNEFISANGCSRCIPSSQLTYELLLRVQVHQPLWALQGFIDDMETWRSSPTASVPADLQTVSAATVQQAVGAAKLVLTRAMLTDAPLIHPPGLLALSAMQNGFAQVRQKFIRVCLLQIVFWCTCWEPRQLCAVAATPQPRQLCTACCSQCGRQHWPGQQQQQQQQRNGQCGVRIATAAVQCRTIGGGRCTRR